jgi:hypothetical protein
VRTIQSLGGPLLVIPEHALPLWHGAYGPDGEDDWPEDETDYWAVSEQVTDYADVVDVRGVPALALANGRSPTRWLDPERLFVQQLAVGREPDTIGAVRRLLASVRWQHHADWTVDAPGVVIDSAEYGPAVNAEERLRIDLPPGRYRVRSAYREPTPDADIFVALTQLVPAGQGSSA